MALKIPEQDSIGKVFSVLQLVIFLALFLTVYLLLRKVVHSALLRVLILIGDYFVVSLLTYLVIRPLMMRAEAALRKRK